MPDAQEIQYLYSHVTQSVNELLELIDEAEGFNICSVKSEYFLLYLQEYRKEWELQTYLDLVIKFEELDGEDFDEYLEMINMGMSEEDAAKGWNDSIDDIDLCEIPDPIFEQWVIEQTDYANHERIEIAYDEDNSDYSEEISDNGIMED